MLHWSALFTSVFPWRSFFRTLCSSGLVMAPDVDMKFSLAQSAYPIFLPTVKGESDGHTSQVLPMRCILRTLLELLKPLIGWDTSPKLLTTCSESRRRKKEILSLGDIIWAAGASHTQNLASVLSHSSCVSVSSNWKCSDIQPFSHAHLTLLVFLLKNPSFCLLWQFHSLFGTHCESFFLREARHNTSPQQEGRPMFCKNVSHTDHTICNYHCTY